MDDAAVVIIDGRIASIETRTGQERGPLDDLGGLTLLPGFIDLHIHGAGGADAHAGEIAALAAFLPRCGVTAFLPTLAADAEARTIAALRATAAAMRDQGPHSGRDRARRAPRRAVPQSRAGRGNPARAYASRRTSATRAPARRSARRGPADDRRARRPRRNRPYPRDRRGGGRGEPRAYRRRLRSLPPRDRRRGAAYHAPLQRDDRDRPSRARCGRCGPHRRADHRRTNRRRRACPSRYPRARLAREGDRRSRARQRRGRPGGSATRRLRMARPTGPFGWHDGAPARWHPSGQPRHDGPGAADDARADPARCGERLVDIAQTLATVPARIIGLPTKGTLAPGYDADIVAIDAEGQVRRTYIAGEIAYTG